jgi:uncharacterized membrane protein
MNRKNLIFGVIVFCALVLLSLVIWIATSLGFIEAFRVVFGSVYVLFLPGFLLTWIVFPKHNVIDWLERIALSFALSIAVVPLIVFYLSLIGLKISALMSFLTVTIINLVFAGLIYWQLKKNGSR